MLEPYHDRMPVILRESDLATWLDPHIEQEQRLLNLLAPFDPAEMSARRVSRLVNSAKKQFARLHRRRARAAGVGVTDDL